ncbi:MAG: hypothetical protein PHS59_13820 [Paludibacter sp.]|nr:hypothetical protein [Paludibacter sp.]
MKTIIKVLLSLSILLLVYFCIMSVLTPIRFEESKDKREKEVIQRLIDIRKAELEFKDQHKYFTDNFDTLISFLKKAKKKTVLKEGTLTDAQLDAGLTEATAVKIVRKGNAKEIADNGLQNFRRDTAYVNLILSIFEPSEYTEKTIDKIAIIPFSNNERFELKVDNNFINSTGILIPVFEASAHYKTYLFDLDHQEMLNVIDLQEKLDKFPGLKVGSVDEPNNNAGNWE